MKRRIVVVFCITVAALVPGTTLRAEDETVDLSPVTQLDIRRRESGLKGVSPVFDNEAGPGASVIVGGPTGGTGFCASTTDTACQPSAAQGMSAYSVLGPCESAAEIGCIESFAVRSTSGDLAPLVKVAGGETVFPEDGALAVPRGTTLTTWEDVLGRRYVVNATVATFMTANSGTWTVGSVVLEVQIVRIQKGSTQTPVTASRTVDPVTGRSTVSYSGSAGNAKDTRGVPLVAGTRFNLRLRVPNSVGGWFQGRVGNAVVGSTSLAGNRTVYEVEGDVMSVYVAAALIPETHPNYSSVPESARGRTTSVLSYPNNVLSNYDTWKVFFEGDKAFTSVTRWTLKSIGAASGKCFAASTGLTGVASTNAAFYQAGVPEFDVKTGSFDYKVASLHYDPTGDLAKGSYSFSMPVAAIQCLYGVTVNPNAARMSVEYNDGQEPSVAVKTVSVKSGWVNVSHSGFTYSAPTLRTTFGVVASDSGSTNTSNFASLLAQQKVANSARNQLRTTIRGSRATLTITLTKNQTVEVFRKVGKKLTLLKRFPGRKGTNTFTTSYKKTYTFLVFGAAGRQIEPAVGSSGVFSHGLYRLS